MVVVDSQLFRQEVPELAHRIVGTHRFGIYTGDGQVDSRTVCQVFVDAEVCFTVTEPEVTGRSCTGGPFPLCLCRKGDTALIFLSQLFTEVVRFLPTHTDYRLFR